MFDVGDVEPVVFAAAVEFPAGVDEVVVLAVGDPPDDVVLAD